MLLLCLTPSVFGGVCVYAPGQQVFWTFFSVIGGGFYFEEFHTLHFLGGLGFAVGVLVVSAGGRTLLFQSARG